MEKMLRLIDKWPARSLKMPVNTLSPRLKLNILWF